MGANLALVQVNTSFIPAVTVSLQGRIGQHPKPYTLYPKPCLWLLCLKEQRRETYSEIIGCAWTKGSQKEPKEKDVWSLVSKFTFKEGLEMPPDP